MRRQFNPAARSADPHARVPTGLDAFAVVAHMLRIARRYQAIVRGDFHRASHPRELDQINHEDAGSMAADSRPRYDQLKLL